MNLLPALFLYGSALCCQQVPRNIELDIEHLGYDECKIKEWIESMEMKKTKTFDKFMSGFEKQRELYNAIKANDLPKVNEILTNYPEISKAICFYFPLHYTCDHGNIDMVDALLNAGFNINECDDEGDTPLHYAVMQRDPDLVRFLVRRGADINAQNERGESPMLMALKDPNPETDAILEHLKGAHVCIRSEALLMKRE